MYPAPTCFFLSIQLQLCSHRIYVLLSEVKGRGDRIDGANLKDNALGNSFPLIPKYLHHLGTRTEAFNTSGNVYCSTVHVFNTYII
jgi:hypothetical protein